MEIQTKSLNNSTSIGKILYTKEERTAQSRVKLPSIYKKNLKQLVNSMARMRSPAQSTNKKQYVTTTEASSRMLDHTTHVGRGEGSNSRDRFRRSSENKVNIMSTNMDEDGDYYHSNVHGDNQMRIRDHNENDQLSMHIQQNKRAESQQQSPRAIGNEIKKLFQSNPDSNPFRILYERNQFDAVNAIHERQQLISKLTQETTTIQQKYLSEQMQQSIRDQSLE